MKRMAILEEIRIKIEKATIAFNKMRQLLCSRDLSLTSRMRILDSFVFSVLLLGGDA